MLHARRFLSGASIVRSGIFALALSSLPGVARAVSPDLVISQVYGGGGNSGATYRNDFIELFNRGSVAVDITGWSVQYASSTGTSWQKTDLAGVVPAGGYYLVQEAVGAGGTTNLPTPDASGTIPMSGTTAKLALVASNTLISAGVSCPGAGQSVVDFVGYGSANCAEGSPTPALSNTTAALRLSGGCSETDNNLADFSLVAPVPRNSASAPGSCTETAPSVASSSPANGATNVAVNSSITVNFNEPVNVSAGAISVECPLGTQRASNGTLTNVTAATLTPPSSLPPGTTCQISVAANGVNDVDLSDPPDTLASNFNATFSTFGGVPCAAVDTPIGHIQGSSDSAALTGVRTVQAVVVGDYEYPGSGTSADYLRGFYLQNAAGSDDGNAATSDAIFVFNGNSNSVSVGQIVQVTGTVGEFAFGSTGGTQTQLTSPSIEICGTGGSVNPVNVSLPFATGAEIERYEGMLVRFPQTLFVTEHFQLGRFGQVLLSATGRLAQPTEVVAPGAPAAAVAAANELRKILVDDDLQSQNPDPIRFGRGGAPLSAANTLRGGDTIAGLTGVLTQTDATSAPNVPAASDPVVYRLRPFNALNPVTPSFQAANPRPGAVAAVAGTLKLAGVNLLNYFNTLGTAGQANCNAGVAGAPLDCRGAENVSEFDRQWPKTVAALLSIDADVYVFNELENDGYGPSSALQDLVTKLNNASAPGTFAFVDVDARTGQVDALGSDAIRVAIVYKPARVSLVGQTAVANTAAYGIYQTSGTPIQRNRPALAQAFQTSCGARLVVVGNHLKSKGGSCADNVSPVGPDPDSFDGQGECNQTRNAAAAQLVSWLQTDPTASGTANTLLLGDYNAYAKEDPITTLQNGGYTDLAPALLGAESYSYVFDGQWGSLDHALASAALLPHVTQVLDWHINADEPGVLDYNTNFKSATQLTGLYASDRFRSSDHDALIVGVTLPCATTPVPALTGRHAAALALLLLVAATLATRAGQRKRRG